MAENDTPLEKDNWKDDWSEFRAQISRNDYKFRFGRTSVPGLQSVEITAWNFSTPIAFIWFYVGCGQLRIGYIFVHEELRRLRLATQLLNYVISCYRDEIREVVTGRGNDLSTGWLLENGFLQDRGCGFWVKRLSDKNEPYQVKQVED